MDSSLHLHRRQWLAAGAIWLGFLDTRLFADGLPQSDRLAGYQLEWTKSLPWKTVVDVTQFPGETVEAQLANAQAMIAAKGGGVIYFPAGVYRFTDSIRLLDGVILRGAPTSSVTTATDEGYAPTTQFEFPKYEARLDGDGTANTQAFKGIYLANPGMGDNVGIVDIAINRGHVLFDDDGSDKHRAGKNRFVVGCVLRNAAVADPNVPNLKSQQQAWQRFTLRHHAAINVKSRENLLIANNRLPNSGEDNFTMNGYVLLDQKRKPAPIDGVVFDYDNRPGIYANHYGIGGSGGDGPDGTPQTHPYGFAKGIVIVDNYVYNTGRTGIGFCGDGVICRRNTVRIPDNIWRPTATGLQITSGSSTNDNRAIEMRGWRWVVEENDYIVHRNWAFDRKYKINDGEGLMHEDHVNSTILDCVLRKNRGNTYLSLYKTAGIDGLLVEENDIRLSDGKQSIANGVAIYVNADRTRVRFPCRRVSILSNLVAGGGILLGGSPGEKNLIRGNKVVGGGTAKILLRTDAVVEGNEGFELAKE